MSFSTSILSTFQVMPFALIYQGNKNKKRDIETFAPAKYSSYDHIKNFKARDFHNSAYMPRASDYQALQRLEHSYNNAARGVNFASIGIQPKLKISQPADEYEQEAERVSEKVMRMPAFDSTDINNQTISNREETINRKCSACKIKEREEDEKKMKISRRTSSSSIIEPTEEVTDEIEEILSGSGSSLDTSTRGLMERKFGHNFGNVRIHTGEKAARFL